MDDSTIDGIADRVLARVAASRRAAAKTPQATRAGRRTGRLAAEIACRRSALGLSLEAFARAIGTDRATAWRLESGREANPTVGTLDRLAETLGVTFERLCLAAIDDVRAKRRKPTPTRRTT